MRYLFFVLAMFLLSACGAMGGAIADRIEEGCKLVPDIIRAGSHSADYIACEGGNVIATEEGQQVCVKEEKPVPVE